MTHTIPAGRLTPHLAAQAAGVAPATIRDWRRRHLLTPCEGSTPRRPLYPWNAVLEARDAPKPARPGQHLAKAA